MAGDRLEHDLTRRESNPGGHQPHRGHKGGRVVRLVLMLEISDSPAAKYKARSSGWRLRLFRRNNHRTPIEVNMYRGARRPPNGGNFSTP